MVDYSKSTGSTGTMVIRDTGTYVEFWLKAGSATFNYSLPWNYVINGWGSGAWKHFKFVAGGDWQRIGRFNITYTQTVTFKIGDSGTSGLGGPTTFSHSINRADAPSAPSAVTITDVTTNSVFGTFTDGASNGDAIDARQIGYGTSDTTVQKTITSDKSTLITGLTPGTKYYFWARTHNSEGWSSWSSRRDATTISIVWVNVGGVWKTAIPYVRVAGIWKVARPWSRASGVWKETR